MTSALRQADPARVVDNMSSDTGLLGDVDITTAPDIRLHRAVRLSQLGISEAPGVFGEAKPDTGHHATQADKHVGR